MTVTINLINGFSFGRPVWYLSMDTSVLSQRCVDKVSRPCPRSDPRLRSTQTVWDLGSAGPNNRAWPFPALEPSYGFRGERIVPSALRIIVPPGSANWHLSACNGRD